MDAETVSSIICPQCESVLDPKDDVCQNCGSATAGSPPPRAGSSGKGTRIRDDRLLNNPWVLLILVLHVGLLGIPVYWKLRYSRSTRILIIVGSIVYTVIAVGGILWGIAQIARLFTAW